jgi:predicted RNase H-like HicB family nuclease
MARWGSPSRLAALLEPFAEHVKNAFLEGMRRRLGLNPRSPGSPVRATMVRMKYHVALLQSEEGFSVWVPVLPGCCSQGQTRQEALDNIADAIRDYLAVRMEQVGTAQLEEIEVAV